jgi:hypothetical protein
MCIYLVSLSRSQIILISSDYAIYVTLYNALGYLRIRFTESGGFQVSLPPSLSKEPPPDSCIPHAGLVSAYVAVSTPILYGCALVAAMGGAETMRHFGMSVREGAEM